MTPAGSSLSTTSPPSPGVDGTAALTGRPAPPAREPCLPAGGAARQPRGGARLLREALELNPALREDPAAYAELAGLGA